jgi:hypothetical protein
MGFLDKIWSMTVECSVTRLVLIVMLVAFSVEGIATVGPLGYAASTLEEEFQVEVTKKGLGKEVLIRRGSQEWFLMVDVSDTTSVVIRQEKNHDVYLVDESETHDHAMSKAEVDAAIEDFIKSVKLRAARR